MLSSIGTMFGGAGSEQEQQQSNGQRNTQMQQHMAMMNNPQDDEYDIHTDYPYDDHSRRSSLSNISNYQSNNNNNNVYGGYENRHSRRISGSMALRNSNQHYAGQPSMASAYADPQVHHNRGLSAAAIRAKQNRRNKHPRHRSKNFSNMS